MLVRPDANGVEDGLGADLVAHAAQAFGEHHREAVHALRDPLQSFRPVVYRVHAGHHGQQYLGRADVARRLVTADVLLARLQSQPVGRLPVGVARQAHDAAWQLALVLVFRGEERGVRAAAPERHAEALARADGDVGAGLAWRA